MISACERSVKGFSLAHENNPAQLLGGFPALVFEPQAHPQYTGDVHKARLRLREFLFDIILISRCHLAPRLVEP